jgi:hypothetical protein
MPAPTIPPVPTTYRGIKYRSRTEAKWAVLFTHFGLTFDYEPETFDIKGVWYLPDFYIKDWDCYFEVKPSNLMEGDEKLLDDAIYKCSGLNELLKKKVLVAAGPPRSGRGTNFIVYHGGEVMLCCHIVKWTFCGGYGLIYDDDTTILLSYDMGYHLDHFNCELLSDADVAPALTERFGT